MKLRFLQLIITLAALFLTSQCQLDVGQNATGADIYKLHCKRCHGSDGKKGKKGAKDLNLSEMDLETRIAHIKVGKDKMPAFEERLSEQQVEKVAEYTLQTFRQDSIKVGEPSN